MQGEGGEGRACPTCAFRFQRYKEAIFAALISARSKFVHYQRGLTANKSAAV